MCFVKPGIPNARRNSFAVYFVASSCQAGAASFVQSKGLYGGLWSNMEQKGQEKPHASQSDKCRPQPKACPRHNAIYSHEQMVLETEIQCLLNNYIGKSQSSNSQVSQFNQQISAKDCSTTSSGINLKSHSQCTLSSQRVYSQLSTISLCQTRILS